MGTEDMATPQGNTSFADTYNVTPSYTPEERTHMTQEASTALQLAAIQPLTSSTWWNSEKVGADLYTVTQDNGEKAVLKMQYAPTNPSEITLINDFQTYAQASHTSFRPPHLYASLPRNTQRVYEALLLEDVQGHPLLPYPANTQEIESLAAPLDKLLVLAQEIDTVPSSAFPTLSQTPPVQADALVAKQFASWQEVRNSRFAGHPFAQSNQQGEILSDPTLIATAIKKLTDTYATVPLRFQHGHIGRGDVVEANDGTIVLFSNLKWGWYLPYRSASFHEWWYLYECANSQSLLPSDIEAIHTQQEKAYARFTAALSPEEQQLLTLARLERATAALNLDLLTLSDTPNTRKAAELTKATVTQLLAKL